MPKIKDTRELVTFGALKPGDLFSVGTSLYEKKRLTLGTPPANAWNLSHNKDQWFSDDQQVVKLDPLMD
jgi:hypothetical protein